MESTLKGIAVGSTSSHKVAAVKQAAEALGLDVPIYDFKVASRVNEQPEGIAEIYGGAMQRATSAKTRFSADQNMAAIGIENGIVQVQTFGSYLDVAIVALITPDYRVVFTTSHGVEVSIEDVEAARRHGFESYTVGRYLAQHYSGDATDPYPYLTDGKITRKDVLADAVKMVLRQL